MIDALDLVNEIKSMATAILENLDKKKAGKEHTQREQ
jgi:hypothetical protein